jgi:hypothetical protein
LRRGLSHRAAAHTVKWPRRTSGPCQRGAGRRDGGKDHHRRKYIYVLPISKVHQMYISWPVGVGPPQDSPVGVQDSPVGGPDSPVDAEDSPVGGPERRPQISKSRPRRVLRIKTGPLTMGKMSCTDRLHTSPIVKDPYSNCVLGTERLHGWHPPNDGRRVCVEVRRKSLLRTYHCWRETS